MSMFTSALGLFSSDKDSQFLDAHHTGKVGDKNAPRVGEKFVEKGNYKNPVLKQFHVETANAKHVFLLPHKFKITKVLGQGAYGVVVAGVDEEKKQPVAIKKIFNVFEQDREYQKRILREVKILKHFRNHENIVSLTDMVPPKNFADFKDVYIVTELMSSDLRAMIRSDQEFNEQDVQYFMYQILKGMKFIHSANVVHRDIKPANILLNNELTLKICDFGLSRSIDVEDPNSSTLYVATRWYRAPELLLVYEKSSKPMDIWSIGCVFAELLDKPKRKPLFPGESYLHQLDLILDVCGTPKDEDICGCDKAKKYVKNKPFKLRKDLSKRYPLASPLAIDLLNKMLTFNPHKRISLEEALEHPFLKDLHEPEEEIVCDEPFTYNLEEKVPTSEIKKILYEDVITWTKQNHQWEGDAIILDDHDNIIYVPSQLVRV